MSIDLWNELQKRLEVSSHFLERLSKECQIYNKHYRTYYISKGSKKPKRKIDAPRKILKEVQAQISEILIAHYKLPEEVQGFVKGKSFLTNAKLHLNRKETLSIDIRDFFPTITKEIVYDGMIKNQIAGNIEAIVNLLTYKTYLPQGSPASPIISNLIFLEYDRRIIQFCKNKNIKYSRYADDLTFSSNENNLNEVYTFTKSLLKDSPFSLNKQKTKFANQNIRQEVTGIVINPGSSGKSRLKMKRRWRREIRAGFYNATKNPLKHRKKYTYLFSCLNLLKQIDRINNDKNIADKKLISLGEKAVKRLRYFRFLDYFENRRS